MRGIKQSVLLFAVLVLVVGCGKKEEAAAPLPQSKATPKAQPKCLLFYLFDEMASVYDAECTLRLSESHGTV